MIFVWYRNVLTGYTDVEVEGLRSLPLHCLDKNQMTATHAVLNRLEHNKDVSCVGSTIQGGLDMIYMGS